MLSDSNDLTKNTEPKFLQRITSGKELLNIINEVHAYAKDYGDPENEEEANLIAEFFKRLQITEI